MLQEIVCLVKMDKMTIAQYKINILIIAIAIIVFCLPLTVSADPLVETADKDPTTPIYAPSPDFYPDKPITEQVNKNVDEIESKLEGVSKKTQYKNAWKPVHPKPTEHESLGKGLLRYASMAPTYLVRGLTWPIGITSHYLVKKGVVRKVVNFVSNDERTFWVYPKLELGFGSGFGGGVGIQHLNLFHKNYKFYGSYQIHVNLNQESNVSIKKPDAFYLWKKPVTYKLKINFLKHNEDDFFGIGATSSRNNKSKYGIDEVRPGGWIGYEFLTNTYAKLHTYLVWNNSRPGSVGRNFPRATLPGYLRNIYYLNYGFTLEHDNRNSLVAPSKGGRREFIFSRYQGLDTENFNYNEYRLRLNQFIKGFFEDHVFALRNEWVYAQATNGNVPFYRLPKLDMNSPMRGFDFSRFTDNGRMVINAEYRFPVWDYIDGDLFFDTGRVFHNFNDFSFKKFKYDGGFGLRFLTKEVFLLRFEMAYGGEGLKVLIKTNQAF